MKNTSDLNTKPIDMSNGKSKTNNIVDFKNKVNLFEFKVRDASGMIIDDVSITADFENNKLIYNYFTEYGEFINNNEDPIFTYSLEKENTVDNTIIFTERLNKLINYSIKAVLSSFKDIKKQNDEILAKEIDTIIDIKKGISTNV